MLTGKYRRGEKGRAEGFGGKRFQPENSAERTKVLDTVSGLGRAIPARESLQWAEEENASRIVA